MSTFSNLVNNQNQEVECPACGAHYDIHLPQCPYCDSINEFGDEERYFESLKDIHEDLKDAEDISEEIYAAEAKDTAKKVGKILIIVGIIIVLVVGAIFSLVYISEQRYKRNVLDDIAWERENYPTLDQWYEEGNYDAIADFMHDLYADNNKHNIWSWEHYEFASAYYDYNNLKASENDGLAGMKDDFFARYYFHIAVRLLYDTWDVKLETVKSINKNEYEMIMDFAPYVRDYLKKYYGLNDEEIDDLKEITKYESPSVGVDPNKCDKYVESLR